MICTLGCELNAEATPTCLRDLYDMARELLPDTLIPDNSGSRE